MPAGGLAAVLLLLASVAISAGCGWQREEGEGHERLLTAFPEWVGHGPLYLAGDKGFFTEEGLDLVVVDDGPAHGALPPARMAERSTCRAGWRRDLGPAQFTGGLE